MDEYHCRAYPNIYSTEFDTENSLHHGDDQYFNVEFEYTIMHVLNARRFHTCNDTTHHSFKNVSKDKMKEETIESWLSHMGVPKDAFETVVAEILECARDMAKRTQKDAKVLSMRVDLVVTTASEDEIDDEEEEDIDDDYGFEEAEEEEDEDLGLVPAAVSSIEGLEMVRVEQEEGFLQGNCSICFENFDVGVRMPCLHMFHQDCISSWLQVGNSCPLCRFQMPLDERK